MFRHKTLFSKHLFIPKKMLTMNRSQIMALQFAIITFLSLPFLSCSSDDETTGYTPDFSYQMDASNPNLVTFTNTSSGEYLYTEWDFGNGETTSKETAKDKEYTIYYPLKGEYEVQLKVWGPVNTTNDIKIISKTVTIEADDSEYDLNGTLVWSDEFDGSNINSSNWTFETGANGWGNNELQNYTNGSNAHIEDGKLVITARKENDNTTAGSYSSTRMISWGKQEFKYGRIEVRAKLPSGRGIWPAIWMLGANLGSAGWPACGEIDIMEYVGYEPDVVHATVHTTAGSGVNGNGSSKRLTTCEEQFHIYGLTWTEEKMEFYIDTPDNITHTYSPASKTAANWPFDKPQFFILNIAVGGNWGGAQGVDNTIFPQTMEVDYVRVYELD